METLLQDLSYGLRTFIKSPGFTIVAVLALALGVGANTAIFSVVNTVLLRPLPYKDSEKLIVIRETDLPQFPEFSVAPGNYLDWKSQNTVFTQLEASNSISYNLIGKGEPERLRGQRVTAGLFGMLGVAPIIGRDFRPEEDKPGAGNVVILSHGLWQRRFGGDPNVLGQSVDLSGKSYTIIGVMDASFQYPGNNTDLFAPMAFEAREMESHGGHYIASLGRLKPGVSLDQARAEMGVIAKRLEEKYPNSNKGWGIKLTPMLEYQVADMKSSLRVLLGAVALVLLIACANVANLLLARATGRQKEIAIRVAVGANRVRIVRQLLTESILLALIGGAFGLLLAHWGMNFLLALAPDDLPRVKDVSLDSRALGFTLLITLVTGVIFGLAPALQASRPDLEGSLKDGSKGSTGGGRKHLIRNALVVVEIGMALVLLAGAGLMIKSFMRLQQVDPGFDPHNVLAASIDLPASKYETDPKQAAFADELIKKISALPGVRSAAASQVLPFSGDYILNFTIQGRPPLPPGQDLNTNYYAVTPDYFKTVSIPLLRGRFFNEYDKSGSHPVAIINDEMARRYFPNEDPIGKGLNVSNNENGPVYREIVGIVGSVKDYSLDSTTNVQTYEPFLQKPFSFMSLVVKTVGDPSSITAALRNQVTSIDKEQPIANVKPMEQFIADSVARQRFTMILLGLFSAVALILAAVGIYGVMAYSVTQRTHEVGIRMALGAQSGDVLKMVVAQGMLLAGIGIVIGAIAAVGLGRIMEHEMASLLFKVKVTDPLILSGISMVLALVALVACYIPARRAAKVDPMIALRYE